MFRKLNSLWKDFGRSKHTRASRYDALINDLDNLAILVAEELASQGVIIGSDELRQINKASDALVEARRIYQMEP